jgi:hypothetical protein
MVDLLEDARMLAQIVGLRPVATASTTHQLRTTMSPTPWPVLSMC